MEDRYRQMARIRKFEEQVLDLFSAGKLVGTTHTSLGQEANAVGVLAHLTDRDIVVSNHRCHGHYLVRTGDADGLLAEMMGLPEGVCGGRGGSQHLHARNFYTNGVQGNLVPVAAGMAWAQPPGAIVVAFIGDGTLGQGVVYETFNLMALWGLPLLVVVENNRIAQTTPVERHLAGSFVGRATAFGLDAGEIESSDVEALYAHFGPIVAKVRSRRPHVEVIHTYRLGPHSKGDDTRTEAELAEARAHDPLLRIA